MPARAHYPGGVAQPQRRADPDPGDRKAGVQARIPVGAEQGLAGRGSVAFRFHGQRVPPQPGEPVRDPDARPVGQPGQAEVERGREVAGARLVVAERVQPFHLVQPANLRDDPDGPGADRDVVVGGQHPPRRDGDHGGEAVRVIARPQGVRTGHDRRLDRGRQQALAGARTERLPAQAQRGRHPGHRPAGQEGQHQRLHPEPEPGLAGVFGQYPGGVQFVAVAGVPPAQLTTRHRPAAAGFLHRSHLE